MKADRRHELRESDLGRWLGAAKSFLNEQGKYVLLLLVVAAAIVAGTSMAIGSRSASQERAWQKRRSLDYSSAEACRESLPTLMALSLESDDQTFAATGLIEVGTRALKFTQSVESPPDQELNELARRAFHAVMERFADAPVAIGAARAGLATVAENDYIALGDESQKEVVRKHLQAILDNPAMATLPYHAIAENRLAGLDKTFTRIKLAVAPIDLKPPADVPQPTPGKKLMKMQIGPDGKLSPYEESKPSPGGG